MVGIALWPGAVEEAFRSVAQHVATHDFSRPKVIELLARYGVHWQEGMEETEVLERAAVPVDELMRQLPAELASSLAERWKDWLQRSA